MAMQQQAQPSLCERLGGIYSIAVVVNDFIPRRLAVPLGYRSTEVGRIHCKRSTTR
jgi:hypothetical protein